MLGRETSIVLAGFVEVSSVRKDDSLTGAFIGLEIVEFKTAAQHFFHLTLPQARLLLADMRAYAAKGVLPQNLQGPAADRPGLHEMLHTPRMSA